VLSRQWPVVEWIGVLAAFFSEAEHMRYHEGLGRVAIRHAAVG
jgi:hypothetical protein